MGQRGITLKPEEQDYLGHFVQAGTSTVRAVKHAYVLLT